MRNPCAEGQGSPLKAGAVMASATGVTTTPTEIVGDASEKYTIIDRLVWSFDVSQSSLDLDLKVIDHFNGTRDIFVAKDDGDITDLFAILDWLDPNPPANTVRGTMTQLGCIALEPTELDPTHTVAIVGNDATAGNNYTGTNAIALAVVAHYRLVEAEWFE